MPVWRHSRGMTASSSSFTVTVVVKVFGAQARRLVVIKAGTKWRPLGPKCKVAATGSQVVKIVNSRKVWSVCLPSIECLIEPKSGVIMGAGACTARYSTK